MTNDEKSAVLPLNGGLGTGTHHWALFTGACRRYATAFLDLLYTRKCEACDVFLESGRGGVRRWLCDACDLGMARIVAPFCRVCGEPYEGGMSESFRCGNCADLKLHFEFALAGYKAEGAVRELVHRFKYQHALHLRGLLGAMLESTFDDARLAGTGLPWILVPVPLFHARQREREYNQALELCRVLGKSKKFSVLDPMSRVRPTTPQASLSRHQRIENLRGAFTLKRSVIKNGTLRGRAILLVDDVLTTGSTTSECARVLRREGGAEKVVVITVARG